MSVGVSIPSPSYSLWPQKQAAEAHSAAQCFPVLPPSAAALGPGVLLPSLLPMVHAELVKKTETVAENAALPFNKHPPKLWWLWRGSVGTVDALCGHAHTSFPLDS